MITSFFKPVDNRGNKETIPCKYFTGAPESCKDGDRCQYFHNPGLVSAVVSDNNKNKINNNFINNNNNNGINNNNPTQQNYQPRQEKVAAVSNEPQVKVPWHPSHVFSCRYTKESRPVWAAVEQYFTEPIETLSSFFLLLSTVVSLGLRKRRDASSFPTLLAAIRTMPEEGFPKKFIGRILPKMIKYVLLAPRAFPNGIPLLTRNCSQGNNKLVFTQLQVSILLCVSFFGLFPQNSYSRGSPGTTTPGCNFTPLYNSLGRNTVGKIKCLLAYFDTITEPSVAHERERGKPCYFDIEFIRTVVPNHRQVLLRMSSSKQPLSQLSVDDAGVIETQDGKLQADFANRVIGGGVLHHGCVQEEIRFVISPELMISRLFVEDLDDHEAIVMSGTLRYSNYVGYGGSFEYAGRILPLAQPSPAEIQNRMFDVSVVAFDAIDFSPSKEISPERQYRFEWIEREVAKAYCAFVPVANSRAPSANCCFSASNGDGEGTWIATGNWGCGVFRGDLELKFILQLIVASFVGRPIQYFTFSNPNFYDKTSAIYDLLDEKRVSVTQLFQMVLRFSELHEKAQDEVQDRIEEMGPGDVIPSLYDIYGPSDNDDDNDDVGAEEIQQTRASSTATVDYEVIDVVDGNDEIQIQEITVKESPKNTNKNNNSGSATTQQQQRPPSKKSFGITRPPKSLFAFIVSQLKEAEK